MTIFAALSGCSLAAEAQTVGPQSVEQPVQKSTPHPALQSALQPVPQPAMQYDKDTKISYGVSNDEKTIYVLAMITEPVQQRKILRNGMELWLDPKAKKNKTTGILFPIPVKERSNNRQKEGDPNARPPSFSKTPGTDSTLRKSLQQLIDGQNEMQLSGFTGELNGTQNRLHPSGLTVSVYFTGDTLVYAAAIPRAILPPSFLADKPFTLGFIRKGMVLPDMPGMGDGNGPPGGGPGGGGPGGGPGDGGGPPGGGMMPGGPDSGEDEDEMQRLFAEDITWYKYKLR